MSDKKKLNNQQMFDALSKAEKQYETYLKVNETIPIVEDAFVKENYNRDLSHPLGIVIQG